MAFGLRGRAGDGSDRPMEEGRMAWLARRDGSVVVGYGPFVAVSCPPEDGVAFYKRDFSGEGELPWQVPQRFEVMSRTDFAARHGGGVRVPIRWEVPDAAPFSLVFQEVMTCIRRGVFEKTVPVVTEWGRAEGGLRQSMLAAMSMQAAPLYSYGWAAEGDGFAGATPELLFALDGRLLTTMALAGTARSEDSDVFAVDEKEIREHEYVAQTLVSKLLDLGSLERSERLILRLGSIVHFHTGIQVMLGDALDARFLIQRLHPTPALGPLPRTDVTMALLKDWRERLGCPAEFGAPFGVWESGVFESVVAIRGLWWRDGVIGLPAGCGMIEASRLVNEWRELRLKREAVKYFLRR